MWFSILGRVLVGMFVYISLMSSDARFMCWEKGISFKSVMSCMVFVILYV